MRILLGVTGGIAAYKAANLIRAFSEQGHEVHTEDKQVDDFRGFRGSLAEVFGDVEGQDAAHPVEAEPLASLVADDVLDLRRERIRRGGAGVNRRRVGGHPHCLTNGTGKTKQRVHLTNDFLLNLELGLELWGLRPCLG